MLNQPQIQNSVEPKPAPLNPRPYMSPVSPKPRYGLEASRPAAAGGQRHLTRHVGAMCNFSVSRFCVKLRVKCLDCLLVVLAHRGSWCHGKCSCCLLKALMTCSSKLFSVLPRPSAMLATSGKITTQPIAVTGPKFEILELVRSFGLRMLGFQLDSFEALGQLDTLN